MRVVIVDSDLKAGRKLAASVEELVPSADILLYGDKRDALTGLAEHKPDVAFIGMTVDGGDGPSFLTEARAANDTPKYVGVVDAPSADASIAWISAGAKLVVARPVDQLGIRTALRNTDGGIDP